MDEKNITEGPVFNSNINTGGVTSSLSKSSATKGFALECDTPGRSFKNQNVNSKSFTKGFLIKYEYSFNIL